MYHLNEDGKWDDRGTGHVSIDYVEVCCDSNNFSPTVFILQINF